LSTALAQQILITIIVVLVMLRNLRSSLLISAILPLGMLGAFIGMKAAGVDANIMALSGIAIAIGTMVDMGIVLTENIMARLGQAPAGANRLEVVRRATREVAPAVLTSTATTIVSFLPIFGLEAAEGKLFRPLAFTKTFAMLAALLLAMVVLPAVGHLILRRHRPAAGLGPAGARGASRREVMGVLLQPKRWVDWGLGLAGLVLTFTTTVSLGLVVVVLAGARLSEPLLPEQHRKLPALLAALAVALAVVVLLADYWLPLGPERGFWLNRLFVAVIVGVLLGGFSLFYRLYPALLRWALAHKALTLAGPLVIVITGATVWRGFDQVFPWLPSTIRSWSPVVKVAHALPGLGREFMPPFDEGSFLYMPTTMPHASVGQALDQLAQLDAAVAAIPEVELAAGKLGRVDSPLDPAPVSMFETVVNYKPEYTLDADGRRATFRYDSTKGQYERDAAGELIADPDGRPFRQWRPHIRSPKDIWKEIQKAAEIPGVTSAPELMPIAARIVMLQSGMRAPMGLKIRGPDLETIEQVGLKIEGLLKQVPSVKADTVIADRIVGKPYLEIAIDREAIARHGISIQAVQDVIQVAIGGRTLTRTVEGRERYPVRVRYARERRDSVEALREILVPSPLGHQIPLGQLSEIRYARGPQVIKSEDTFLTGYVVFDRKGDLAEVEVVEQAKRFLEHKIKSRELVLPAGVSYAFTGNYENQLRSDERLLVLFPLALTIRRDLGDLGRDGAALALRATVVSGLLAAGHRSPRPVPGSNHQPVGGGLGGLHRPGRHRHGRRRRAGNLPAPAVCRGHRRQRGRHSPARARRRHAAIPGLPDDHGHHGARPAPGHHLDRQRRGRDAPHGPARHGRHDGGAHHLVPRASALCAGRGGEAEAPTEGRGGLAVATDRAVRIPRDLDGAELKAPQVDGEQLALPGRVDP
ncbi:MAG: efflux RND transporter permease subunit, partial [Deltaproteobacteria bacterium]|nr:efflux RND transporter permease subunit [Deltaproteobacteria bacterium]